MKHTKRTIEIIRKRHDLLLDLAKEYEWMNDFEEARDIRQWASDELDTMECFVCEKCKEVQPEKKRISRKHSMCEDCYEDEKYV